MSLLLLFLEGAIWVCNVPSGLASAAAERRRPIQKYLWRGVGQVYHTRLVDVGKMYYTGLFDEELSYCSPVLL
jgi:hypothetical protein